MSTTPAVIERPEISGGVVFHANGLEFMRELPFNEWRALIEKLLATTERGLWSLGDAWNEGQARFGKDYHAALSELAGRSRMLQGAGRVAGAFELPRRRGQLSFELHEAVASLDAAAQDAWLDEVERQGWNRQQLQFAFAEQLPRRAIPALSLRVVDDRYQRVIEAADRRDVDPKAWLIEAIDEKLARERALAAA